MKIRISGKKFGERSVLNSQALNAYSPEERQAMFDSAVGVSIFLKDQSREDQAKSVLKELCAHFKGEVYSKASEFGWVVGQELEPTRDDYDAIMELISQ